MPLIEVNGRKVHIQELNPEGKKTLVLIHGMFSNLSVYYFRIAPLLARHFHVLMYDLRSHGLSERSQTGYTLQQMSEDLQALLTDRKLHQVSLTGYSFGGLIALDFTMRLPSRVEKLAIIDAPDPADQRARDIIDDYSREFLDYYVHNFRDTTNMKMGKRQFEKNHRMYEFLFNETTIRKDMLEDVDFFRNAGLAGVPPTLLLYGAQSNCLEAGKALAAQINHAELQLMAGDHNLPVQHPETVAERLLHHFTRKHLSHG